MLCKRRLFALAAALSAFAALSGAQAQPAFVGRTLQFDNTSITSVGYDYPGDYGYRSGYRDDGPFGLLEIPFALLGGVGKLLTGGHGEPYYGDSYNYDGSYYPRPFYDSQYMYYGSRYRDADNGRPYYGSLYKGGSYHFGSRYDSRRYNDDRRTYEDRGYFAGRYDDDRRADGYVRYFSPRFDDERRAYGRYDGEHRYYDDRYFDDAYRARRYDGYPRYGDAYDRGRASYDADDDD
jgi:hypothetical protein